jgi:aminopeptidase N
VRRAALRARLLVVALAWAAPLAADTYPRQPGIDVVHYSFALTLSDETDRIEGEATIDLRFAGGGATALELDLVAESPETGRGMKVSAVRDDAAPLRFVHDGERLKIDLGRPGRTGERRRVVVHYAGVPATGLLIAPNKHGDRTFFSDNWPVKARHWLPVVDHPYEKATSEMAVTAPAHYQVVSNGLLAEETDVGDGRRRTRWRQSVPIAAWLYAVGVARFAVEHRPAWRGRPIETWVYPQDRDAGFRAFAEPTRDVLDFFEDRVGPFSYERLAHVQANGVRGGMEVATSIFYGDDSVADPASPRWWRVRVHEIAHQWWGNAVTESDWDDVWLSEGFATYFTHLFVEHELGRDAFVAGLRADRDAIREFDAKNPDYRIVHDQLADMSKVLSGVGTYRKGGWVLHMLRGMVGDEAFWNGIRAYYRDHRDGHATTDDFRRAMEAASGRDLRAFFAQWLTRGGMMKVRASWHHDAAAGQLRLDVEQVHPQAPYAMPLRVAIELPGEAGRRDVTLELAQRRQQFDVPVPGRPTSIALDPDFLLLMDAELAERTP